MRFSFTFEPVHHDRVDELTAGMTQQQKVQLFASARFESVRAIRVYRERYLKPLEVGMLTLADRDKALLALYWRQIAVLQSVARIGGPIHFQMLASAARMIFELGVDIALVAKDPTDESAKRLWAFTQVETLRVSQKVAKFYETHIPPRTLDLDMHKQTAHDVVLKNKAVAFVTQYWDEARKRKKDRADKFRPSHWSAYHDLRTRAACLDVPPDSKWEGRYLQVYPLLSWHIHSGLVGVIGMQAEGFDAVAAASYGVILDVVLDSYETVGKELFWSKAMPEWHDRLSFLRDLAGYWYFEMVLRTANQTAGFEVLEEDELKI